MFEVANRSVESWGPLAGVDEREFKGLINSRRGDTKDLIKAKIKKQKKLKTYKVSFKKEWYTDQVELQAESDWEIDSVAAAYFKENEDKIGFKERARSKWADSYKGYDTISYVKVRT